MNQEPKNILYQQHCMTIFVTLAQILQMQGKDRHVRPYLLQASQLARSLKDEREVAHISLFLGDLALDQGNYAQAKKDLLKALQTYRSLHEPAVEAEVLHRLGIAAQIQGEQNDAENYFRESLAINERLGNIVRAAINLNQIGALASEAVRPLDSEGSRRSRRSVFQLTDCPKPNTTLKRD